MTHIRKFSPEVTRNLKHYVYLYLDPRDAEIFYVGKGRGNRAFSHLNDGSESQMAERIVEIRQTGHEPVVEILAHGFEDPEAAYRLEAAAIDLIGTSSLTNAVRGWRSGTYGRMGAEQIRALYGAEKAKIEHPVILIRINRLFRYGMSKMELYDATRGIWRVGEDREKVEFAFAVYEGVVQEVYKIKAWFPAGSTLSTRGDLVDPHRWEFVGRVADDPVRDRYRYKSVGHVWDEGARNPIRYINVKGQAR